MNYEYYSHCGNLTISVTKPSVETLADGRKVEVGEKIIIFTPLTGGRGAGDMGNKNWGHFITQDEELMEFLEKRRSDQRASGSQPDVLTPAEWMLELVPAEERAKRAEAEVAILKRQLSEGNQVGAIVDAQASQGIGPAARK